MNKADKGAGPLKSNSPGTRRLSRELAIKLLFHHEQMQGQPEETVKIFNDCFSPENDVEGDLGLSQADFKRAWPLAKELFFALIPNLPQIDEAISRAAANWTLARMSPVDRSLLRLAYYEMRFRDDIPGKVSLNEALEIAKEYGDDDSVAFINGVLDKLLKGLAD